MRAIKRLSVVSRRGATLSEQRSGRPKDGTKSASSSRQANATQPQPERSSAPVGAPWKWPHCVVTKKPWIAPGLPFVRVSSIPRTFQNVVSKKHFEKETYKDSD